MLPPIADKRSEILIQPVKADNAIGKRIPNIHLNAFPTCHSHL